MAYNHSPKTRKELNEALEEILYDHYICHKLNLNGTIFLFKELSEDCDWFHAAYRVRKEAFLKFRRKVNQLPAKILFPKRGKGKNKK